MYKTKIIAASCRCLRNVAVAEINSDLSLCDSGAHPARLDYHGAIALEAQNAGFEGVLDPDAFLAIALQRAKMIFRKTV